MKDLTIQDIETIVKRDECRVMEAKEQSLSSHQVVAKLSLSIPTNGKEIQK
jgi:hypothetical protein